MRATLPASASTRRATGRMVEAHARRTTRPSVHYLFITNAPAGEAPRLRGEEARGQGRSIERAAERDDEPERRRPARRPHPRAHLLPRVDARRVRGGGGRPRGTGAAAGRAPPAAEERPSRARRPGRASRRSRRRLAPALAKGAPGSRCGSLPGTSTAIRSRLDQLTAWLARAAPDVICMQETKVEDDLFPHEALGEVGYRAAVFGQKTYNGVAIAAKFGLAIEDVKKGLDDDPPDAQRRLIAATIEGVRIIDVYVPNGQAVGAARVRVQARVARAAARAISRRTAPAGAAILVCGDFNVAPEPIDVLRPQEVGGQRALHARGARGAPGALLAGGCVDVFRDAPPGRGRPLLVVGLPHGRLPQEPRPAHRPRALPPRRSRRAASPSPSTSARASWSARPTTRRVVVEIGDDPAARLRGLLGGRPRGLNASRSTRCTYSETRPTPTARAPADTVRLGQPRGDAAP